MGPAPAVEQRVIPEADLSDVMREQLDFLIDANMAGTASNDQMNRLRATSRRAIGDKTQISRHVERGANLVPDDDEQGGE